MTATRMYFAAAGTPAITPAFNSLWASTSSAAQRPLQLASQLSTGSGTTAAQISETSTTSPFDRLTRQHASDSQVAVAHTISGTFSMVVAGFESSANLNGFLQVTISVWDSTGVTKRGDLYAGQTQTSESATASDPNGEFPLTTPTTRILSGITLTPVAAQVGDRIVVEFGFRACNTSATSMGVVYRLDDRAASSDYALTAGLTTTLRPWIEFSDDIFVTSAAYTGDAAKTVTVAATSTGTIGKVGAATKTVTISSTAAAKLGLSGSAAKTITVGTASTGTRGKVGGATRALSIVATSSGSVLSGIVGAAAKTVTISATSAANLGLSGAAAKAITITATSGGAKGKSGAAAGTVTIATAAAATLGLGGAAARVLTIAATSTGTVANAVSNVAAITLSIVATSSGTIGHGPVVGTRRWTFRDTVTDETWTVPINPDSMTSPEFKRVLSVVPGHPKNLFRPRAMRLPGEAITWSFSGAIRTQTHLDTLNDWASRTVAIEITDHIGRTFRVFITKFTPSNRKTRKTIGGLSYHWRYAVDTTLLERVT